MKKEVKNRIVMPLGNGRKLARAFGVTPQTVSYVMNGHHCKSELARRLRHAAVKEYGGVEVKMKNSLTTNS